MHRHNPYFPLLFSGDLITLFLEKAADVADFWRRFLSLGVLWTEINRSDEGLGYKGENNWPLITMFENHSKSLI